MPQLPQRCWGVYSWCSWRPHKTNRASCPNIVGAPIVLHWRSLEPSDGELKFDEQLGQRLKQARENQFHVFTMIWVGPMCPAWLYEKGVPKVTTDRKGWTFPYYFDPTYQRHFERLIRKFGQYVRSLPAELRQRIIFVQVCEGSTGDGYCYKGRPTDSRYAISRDAWGKFRMKTWGLFKEVFQDGDGEQWREKTMSVDDAHFPGGLPQRSDLMLRHISGDDTVFHMIELDRK